MLVQERAWLHVPGNTPQASLRAWLPCAPGFPARLAARPPVTLPHPATPCTALASLSSSHMVCSFWPIPSVDLARNLASLPALPTRNTAMATVEARQASPCARHRHSRLPFWQYHTFATMPCECAGACPPGWCGGPCCGQNSSNFAHGRRPLGGKWAACLCGMGPWPGGQKHSGCWC